MAEAFAHAFNACFCSPSFCMGFLSNVKHEARLTGSARSMQDKG